MPGVAQLCCGAGRMSPSPLLSSSTFQPGSAPHGAAPLPTSHQHPDPWQCFAGMVSAFLGSKNPLSFSWMGWCLQQGDKAVVACSEDGGCMAFPSPRLLHLGQPQGRPFCGQDQWEPGPPHWAALGPLAPRIPELPMAEHFSPEEVTGDSPKALPGPLPPSAPPTPPASPHPSPQLRMGAQGSTHISCSLGRPPCWDVLGILWRTRGPHSRKRSPSQVI